MCTQVQIYTYLSKIYISSSARFLQAFITVQMWGGRPCAMPGREETTLLLSPNRGYLELRYYQANQRWPEVCHPKPLWAVVVTRVLCVLSVPV